MKKNSKNITNIRTGRFLCLAEKEQQKYLKDLKERIKKGYFFNDAVVSKIVDEIAPVINESIDN